MVRYDNVTLSPLLLPARVTNRSHSTYGSGARSDSHRAVFCPNSVVRDRSFNLKGGGGGYGFLFRSDFFYRTTQELEYLFFCRAKGEFFFQNLTLGYITKTLIRLFFFPPPKSEYFFQQH